MSRAQPRDRQQFIACLVLIVCRVSSAVERSPVFDSESRSDSSEKRLALASAEPWRSRGVSSLPAARHTKSSTLKAAKRFEASLVPIEGRVSSAPTIRSADVGEPTEASAWYLPDKASQQNH